MVEGMSVVVNVMLSLMSVLSPPPALCNLSLCTVVKLCTLGVLTLELSFLNCDEIYMCVVNKQFEFLEFVSESVHVDFAIALVAEWLRVRLRVRMVKGSTLTVGNFLSLENLNVIIRAIN